MHQKVNFIILGRSLEFLTKYILKKYDTPLRPLITKNICLKQQNGIFISIKKLQCLQEGREFKLFNYYQ